MESIPMLKSDRLLVIHARLVNGEVLNKKRLAQQFCVTERSIQRDIESLRCFFTEQGMMQDIVYDKKARGYCHTLSITQNFRWSRLTAQC